MKFRKKYFWLVVLLVGLVGIIYAYKEYTRKPADLSSVEATASLDAKNLVTLYEQDEQKANQLYLGKPINVTGTISEIINQQDTMVNIILGREDEMHRVSCLIDARHVNNAKQYKQGDKITIRGICTGYLMDVELNRCVVVR